MNTYKFTIYYGKDLDKESSEFKVEAERKIEANEKAMSASKKWLKEKGYPFPEFSYHINWL